MAEISFLTPADVAVMRDLIHWWRRQGPDFAAALRRRWGPPPAPPHILWGKVAVAWSVNENLLYLNPCRQDGSEADTNRQWPVYLTTPTDSAPPTCDLAVGDVVAFCPFYDVTAGEMKGVLLRNAPDAGSLFPITMAQTGGSQGTNAAAASWTYTVTDTLSGATIGTGVNPVNSPHLWRRPSIGQMVAATAGLAYRTAAGALVITWTNEVEGPEACA